MTDNAKSPLRPVSEFRTGVEDDLERLIPLDLKSISSFDELLSKMGNTAFAGRSAGEAADILARMAADEECSVILTLSGAMTVAKMGLIISDMVKFGCVDAIVTTGALVCHGLVESCGMSHFKLPHDADDTDLYRKGYCRVYDTLELEKNLEDLELIIHDVLSAHDPRVPLSSHQLCAMIGEYLEQTPGSESILGTCWREDVPVFIPAFTDSELALDFAIFNRRNRSSGKPQITFDPFLDLEKYTDWVLSKKKLGIITIGGGVPRNWAQQVGPYTEALKRKAVDFDGDPVRFHYGVRICPEPTHWGGLSGCTYSEGVSWGKFVPQSEGGRYAEVYADATLALPLIAMAVFQRLGKLG